MRTTVDIDDQLLNAAKQIAVKSGRTLTAVIEDSLRETFARRLTASNRQRIQLPSADLGPTLPGVDLDNSAALLDILEGADGPV
jgi:predicted transcriptional regulator